MRNALLPPHSLRHGARFYRERFTVDRGRFLSWAGLLARESRLSQDFPLMQGLFLVITLANSANLLVDLLYWVQFHASGRWVK